MITKGDFFGKSCVSIFTDASSKVVDGHMYICPGVCIYISDILVYQRFDIIKDITVMQGELKAIMMGIEEAYKFQQYGTVRLYSDSLSSILAIRDRIFQWIDSYFPIMSDDELSGEKDGIVKNLPYIMDIIYCILQYDIHIELYHIKGHINCNNKGKLYEARGKFVGYNHMNDKIDLNTIRMICTGNDQVDRFTGLMLDLYYNHPYFNRDNMTNVLTLGYAPFDTNQYRYLIGSKK